MKKRLLILLLFLCSCSSKDIEPSDDFCGTSTLDACIEDSGCSTGGCSGEICQSINTEPLVSTCEWKDCYQNANHECKCIDSQCKWI